MKNKAVFLDRDGTIARDVHYCRRPEDFEILSTVPEAIKFLNENGFKVVVITNQSGIARGYFSEETLAQIHDKVHSELSKHGAYIDAIYYCPHHPDDACECRKPKTALFLKAVEELDIDLSTSYVVGDMQMDIEAGKVLGCKTTLVTTGPQSSIPNLQSMISSPPDYTADSLLEAARWIAKDAKSSQQLSQHKIVAAIPCFNTERFIGDMVSRVKKHVDQVIVINDGSCDNTAEVARAAGALVINHGVNKGYGESIKSCLEAAKANSADILAIMDGDGQHNPDELPRLLAPVVSGEAALVIGSRFLNERSNMPRYRKFGIAVITWLFSVGSKIKVCDAQSGFRAYNREVLDALMLSEGGMGISVEVLIKCRDKGFRIKEVPITCTYHSSSSTMNPVVHGLGVALTVIKLRLENFVKRLL